MCDYHTPVFFICGSLKLKLTRRMSKQYLSISELYYYGMVQLINVMERVNRLVRLCPEDFNIASSNPTGHLVRLGDPTQYKSLRAKGEGPGF